MSFQPGTDSVGGSCCRSVCPCIRSGGLGEVSLREAVIVGSAPAEGVDSGPSHPPSAPAESAAAIGKALR